MLSFVKKQCVRYTEDESLGSIKVFLFRSHGSHLGPRTDVWCLASLGARNVLFFWLRALFVVLVQTEGRYEAEIQLRLSWHRTPLLSHYGRQFSSTQLQIVLASSTNNEDENKPKWGEFSGTVGRFGLSIIHLTCGSQSCSLAQISHHVWAS